MDLLPYNYFLLEGEGGTFDYFVREYTHCHVFGDLYGFCFLGDNVFLLHFEIPSMGPMKGPFRINICKMTPLVLIS